MRGVPSLARPGRSSVPEACFPHGNRQILDNSAFGRAVAPEVFGDSGRVRVAPSRGLRSTVPHTELTEMGNTIVHHARYGTQW